MQKVQGRDTQGKGVNMKRLPADTEFSKCIRARTGYKCERCGKQYQPSDTGLHCSHNFSRRHRTIRWCKENALALCYSCHQWFGGNPADSAIWLENKIGAFTINVLREKMNSKFKVSKLEEKDIAAHYRKELKKIQAQEGLPPFEFDSWQ